MRIEVTLPSLDDEEGGQTRGTVCAWLTGLNAWVEEGGDLLEVTTDKAAFVVPSPVAGCVVEYAVAEGVTVSAGDILCWIETESK